MQLIKPQFEHIQLLMSWFTSEQELTHWGGPGFRFPFDQDTFCEDLKLDTLGSYGLLSEGQLIAFGQFYNRLNRCHLGRLVVNSEFRGQGVASELIQRLCELGLEELNVKECSLFVIEDNKSAIRAYEKFGFKFTDYPEKLEFQNCLYMIKSFD